MLTLELWMNSDEVVNEMVVELMSSQMIKSEILQSLHQDLR